MSSNTPITDRIVSDVRYAAGVELVRECDTGLTLGDAGIARRQAAVCANREKVSRGADHPSWIGHRGDRAYWLGIARELRTRRAAPHPYRHVDPFATADSVDVIAGCEGCGGYVFEGSALCSNCELATSEDSELCSRCGKRSDWHDAYDGACPDDNAPHPYSVAADKPTASERIRSARNA